jgi:hypothetical protein
VDRDRVVGDGVVLAAAYDHSRQEYIRLPEGLGLQIGHDGKFGDVVFGIAHHLLEQIVGDLHLHEVEINRIRTNATVLERFGVRIIAQHRMQLELCCSRHECNPSSLGQNRIERERGPTEDPILIRGLGKRKCLACGA